MRGTTIAVVILAAVAALLGLGAWRLWLPTAPPPVNDAPPLPPVEPTEPPWTVPATWPVEPPRTIATTTAVERVRAASATSGVARVERPTIRTPADAIRGEYVLRFYSAGERDAFVKLAGAAGVTVLGQSRVGYSVRVRAGDGAAWEALLAKVPTPVEQSANVRIRVPPIPAKPPEAEVPKGGYLPFGLDGVFLSGGAVDRRDWGRGVAVAVLDTGASTELAAGSDLVRVDLLDGEPGGEHGTAVASLIAGRGPRVVGVAPAASLISVRVASEEGGGDAFTLAEGIVEAADRGAKVINVCLASRGDCFIVRDAVAYAAGKGAVIVAAVGNDGVSGVSYPAAYDGVIAVSGVDRLGRHLAFANEGAAVDLAAPGIGVAAAGSDQTVVSFSGTSAAAPFVSGAAAALWSRYPRLSAEEVTAVLLTSARDVGPPGGDEQYGAGVLDIRRAMDWSRGGLHDAMVGWPYITPLERTAIATEDRQDVLLSVQNRGTEALGRLSLEVEVDGVPSVIPFHNVDVGQTVTHRLSLALAPGNRARTVSLTCRAVLDGVSDANPADNERRVVLQIGQKASEGM